VAGLNVGGVPEGGRQEVVCGTRDELVAAIAAEEAKVASLEREATRARLESLWQQLEMVSAPLVLATGRYIGEGFDNARLDTPAPRRPGHRRNCSPLELRE